MHGSHVLQNVLSLSADETIVELSWARVRVTTHSSEGKVVDSFFVTFPLIAVPEPLTASEPGAGVAVRVATPYSRNLRRLSLPLGLRPVAPSTAGTSHITGSMTADGATGPGRAKTATRANNASRICHTTIISRRRCEPEDTIVSVKWWW